MRALPVCYLERARERVRCSRVLLRSLQLYTRLRSLSLSLSLGFEFEHLTIGFDVDHKTSVSNSGCQLTKNGKNADWLKRRGPPYWISGQAQLLPLLQVTLNRHHWVGTCVFFGRSQDPREASGRQPRGWKVSWLCKVVLFSFSLFFFHTKQTEFFFLPFFVVLFSAYACCSVAVLHSFCIFAACSII